MGRSFDPVNLRNSRHGPLQDISTHVLHIGQTLAKCMEIRPGMETNWANKQLTKLDILLRCLDATDFRFWVDDRFRADKSHVEHLLEYIAEFAHDCLAAARAEGPVKNEWPVDEWDWESEGGSDVRSALEEMPRLQKDNPLAECNASALVEGERPRLQPKMEKLEEAIRALARKIQCMHPYWHR
ncbi:hypothetical protein BO78DRAFT_471586 [Aspergillus sclerotiicarbonarius CBS 121057]|uniref:Uncharacterized protein n=1 Tax=Aspergillus sclerotiicarbonarius (strain CBS 121057 / IBT 28362) TaxID=1448318 RepID=A0A319E1M7_ASPSB|nr:hypothetical protein BO78DRAFT_471586 [Aspergillus sclerotiicarbonarius CBS 121057]